MEKLRIGGQVSRMMCLAGLVLGFANSLYAQQATPSGEAAKVAELEKRVRDLEAIIRRMDAERQATKRQPSSGTGAEQYATPATPAENEVTKLGSDSAGNSKESDGKRKLLAGWNEGFFLRSSDDQFKLRITGQIQADYRAFLDNFDYVDTDSFFLRRARLGIEADMFKYYEFRMLPDFGLGKATIQDAYLNVHYWDAFQIEVGKFKQPVSYEQLIQDRYVPTLERSLIDQLVPARDEGIMIHGQKLFDNRLDYAIAVSNGGINADSDTNDRKDINGRLVLRPFAAGDSEALLHGLQIGISGGVGIEQEPANPVVLKTPAGTPWFSYLPTVRADGERVRCSPELSYFYRSFGFATQYYWEDQRLRPAFTGASAKFFEDVSYNGYYFLATYLLTGEERTAYSQQIVPRCSFNPCCPLRCSGAWEAVARMSRLRLDPDAVFALGAMRLADPKISSSAATELSLGFNWYLNKWVRMQFNWEHDWFDDPIRIGPGFGGLTQRQDALMSRFQIIF